MASVGLALLSLSVGAVSGFFVYQGVLLHQAGADVLWVWPPSTMAMALGGGAMGLAFALALLVLAYEVAFR